MEEEYSKATAGPVTVEYRCAVFQVSIKRPGRRMVYPYLPGNDT
jgi:hypothetical protein